MSETAQECGPLQRVCVGCDAWHGGGLPWSGLSLAHSLQHPWEPAYKFRRKRKGNWGGGLPRGSGCERNPPSAVLCLRGPPRSPSSAARTDCPGLQPGLSSSHTGQALPCSVAAWAGSGEPGGCAWHLRGSGFKEAGAGEGSGLLPWKATICRSCGTGPCWEHFSFLLEGAEGLKGTGDVQAARLGCSRGRGLSFSYQTVLLQGRDSHVVTFSQLTQRSHGWQWRASRRFKFSFLEPAALSPPAAREQSRGRGSGPSL